MVVGVGALGSSISHQLVRGGVGRVRLIDGDVVEIGNLHRQILYTEEDAAAGRSKAEVAAERLGAANSDVSIEAEPIRLTADNASELLGGFDVVLDGTDNLATRYVINDYCVVAGIPWIYGGIAGVHGLVMAILPGRGPCLRCLFPEDPPEIEVPTSLKDGVFGPTPAVIGSLEAAQAMRFLVGDLEPPVRLLSVDVWTGATDALVVHRAPGCPACGAR